MDILEGHGRRALDLAGGVGALLHLHQIFGRGLNGDTKAELGRVLGVC